MVFLVFGFLIIVGSFFLRATPQFPQAAKISTLMRLAGILVMILGLAYASIVQINPGEVGVQTLFGKVKEGNMPSGLNFINPFSEVTKFDTKTQNYTMSAVHDEGEKAGDDAIRVLTADGLEVTIDLTVLYRIDPSQAPRILSDIGMDYNDKVVRPITRTRIRDAAVYYDAIALYSTKRDTFQRRIFHDIEVDFTQRGLILEQLLIRNIALPESVKVTIEEKISAEQEAQKMQFVLQKEKQEAERKRVEAQGIADYQKILSTGLSDKQLQYEMIKAQKEIATSPNTKVIIMDSHKANIMLGQ